MSDKPRHPTAKSLTSVTAFFQHEAAGGLVLLAAALLALLIANSPLHHQYEALLETPASVSIGALSLSKGLLHWINDGLMAIFFLLVGLEIKRELWVGELSSPRQAALPALAALGGMLAPALVYAALNWQNPATLRGWAIPAATDIAFAIGVLALLGNRIPPSLKVFLLALAIIDDLGAIVIIAIFYTQDLSLHALALAGAGCIGLALLNNARVLSLTPYLLVGVFIWVCVLKSGVHATLAGVVTALAIPLLPSGHGDETVLERVEHALHDWVTFLILPLFAFANAGVSFAGLSWSQVVGPVPLGIMLGLLIGKPLGIFGTAWLAIRLRIVEPPAGASDSQILGVACLGGIGFTMSLFIGMLAFPEPQHAAGLRLGVLAGSLASALLGVCVLLLSNKRVIPN